MQVSKINKIKLMSKFDKINFKLNLCHSKLRLIVLQLCAKSLIIEFKWMRWHQKLKIMALKET